MSYASYRSVLCLTVPLLLAFALDAQSQPVPRLSLLGRYQTGHFNVGAAEIAAYDPDTQRLFFVSAGTNQAFALDLSNPALPVEAFTVDLSPYGTVATSVAVAGGVVAVAVGADPVQEPGTVAFFDTDGHALGRVTVGALPDNVAFTPDGRTLLVANEGEPNDDYTVDPEGSVSLIDLSGGVAGATVATAAFTDFDAGGARAAQLPAGVRIFGPNASVAQDLEPEFVAVSPDGARAYVTLQENNALAVIDLASASVEAIVALGFKDHNVDGHGFDPSNRDDAIAIGPWPLLGMYQPDAIAADAVDGATYLVTANEGDARDYGGFSEQARVKDLRLDATAYPEAAALQQADRLGRLTTTTALGDPDRDGDVDQIYAFGARSFSIWDADGALVYDSGEDFEAITARELPADFNATNDENGSFDNRSDDKGPEPEGVALGTVGDATYAFIGLERVGGVLVYDVSDPLAPIFVQYVNTRDFLGDAAAGTAGDLGPEGLVFIPAVESPNATDLLIVANEVSGSVSIFAFSATPTKP